MTSFRVKRTCVHNLRVTESIRMPKRDIPEGLILPKELMELADIAPFEQIIVTKIGGDNWINRIHTFAIPGKSDEVVALGATAHLLAKDEITCIITMTQLDEEQYKEYIKGTDQIPLIDIRYYPYEKSQVMNDLSKAKIRTETISSETLFNKMTPKILDLRKNLCRNMLSNLLTEIEIEEIERGGCFEMSAELPEKYMKLAGFVKNQSILVYNASRGGMTAESYVVGSDQREKIGISGALSFVVDKGDIISEASYVLSTDEFVPTIYNERTKFRQVGTMSME